jgi:hypothetical protein
MPPVIATRLAVWHRRAVIWASIAVAATGLVWMAYYYAIQAVPAWDGPDARRTLHHVIVAHGVAAYLGVLVWGSLFGRHIPAGLQSRRKLVSGIAALALAAVLVITGLLLYYAGGEGVRSVSSIAHQVFGVAVAVVVAVHVLAKAHHHRRVAHPPSTTR